ncbi:unnamed protein product [Allacma fusca]|uniref:Uncharacterized protein n=1 Tax=Allacma fusca TaxID=39272 RepID=A0A8J2PXH7_9HEXA|nr:unnamed protein product [Allacma fusca]
MGPRRKTSAGPNHHHHSNSLAKQQDNGRSRSSSLPQSSAPHSGAHDVTSNSRRKNSHRGSYVSEMRFP